MEVKQAGAGTHLNGGVPPEPLHSINRYQTKKKNNEQTHTDIGITMTHAIMTRHITLCTLLCSLRSWRNAHALPHTLGRLRTPCARRRADGCTVSHTSTSTLKQTECVHAPMHHSETYYTLLALASWGGGMRGMHVILRHTSARDRSEAVFPQASTARSLRS